MFRRFVFSVGLALAGALLTVNTATAQTGVLSGTVFSGADRTGLAGATVVIVGTKLSAVTGHDGRFTIADVPAGDQSLRIRLVGFAPAEDRVRVAAGDTTNADYEMLSTPVAVRTRVIREIPAEPMVLDKPISEYVIVDPDGHPVGKPALVFRKTETVPLIIVDGVIISNGETYLKELDPQRIEAVEVVKGEAATASYGSRASNGVLIITTKPRPPQD